MKGRKRKRRGTMRKERRRGIMQEEENDKGVEELKEE